MLRARPNFGAARAGVRTYFNKVLVANRGEIACRVIQTCRRLGVPTVAIYSTADAKSKHVSMADEAYCVGPPASSESYLQAQRIVDICKKAGVDAVHPGYGFLSENGQFSQLLADNGITFIGPTNEAISAMGDKIESKRFAMRANVNIIPGFDGEVQNEDHLVEIAKDLGYPIMMKASAGGGGKGMRVAWNDKEARHGFKLCKTEAKASFNDDRMLVEKFVAEPRHIEIQIIADKHGNVLYLPERECSIQRRNQKVIEEAPSTFITPEVRKAMGEQAAALARAVNYHTAGTVEMMVDKDRNFYFLEMNTRLQVEHPVTEVITGLDLVDEMMRAAAGKQLSVRQEDVKINGWATECRVYAEDPLRDYLPVIGRLTKYEEPTGDGVRVDSGIVEGSEISVYYDPMISKLITWGHNRDESRTRMLKALDKYVIRGLGRNNINLLRDVLEHPRYVSGSFTTKFLQEEYPNGYHGHTLTESERMELICAAVLAHKQSTQLATASSSAFAKYSTRFVVEIDGKAVLTELRPDGLKVSRLMDVNEAASIRDSDDFEGRLVQLHSSWEAYQPILKYFTDGAPMYAQVLEVKGLDYKIQFLGTQYEVRVMTPQEAVLQEHMRPVPTLDASKALMSPMPGVVVEVHVKPGQRVKAGDDIVTLEAMKMRNALQAVVDAVVKEVRYKVGDNVDEGEILVHFETPEK